MGNKRKILASLLVLLLVYQTPVHAVVAGSSIGPQSSGARTEGSDGVRNLAEPDIITPESGRQALVNGQLHSKPFVLRLHRNHIDNVVKQAA